MLLSLEWVVKEHRQELGDTSIFWVTREPSVSVPQTYLGIGDAMISQFILFSHYFELKFHKK